MYGADQASERMGTETEAGVKIRRKTAFVFQNYNLFRNKTALQNVTEGLVIARKMPRSQAEKAGKRALDKVGLWDRYDPNTSSSLQGSKD